MFMPFAHALESLSRWRWGSFTAPIAPKKAPLKTEQRLPDPVLDTMIQFLNIPDVWSFSLTNKDLAARMHAKKHNYNELHDASRFIALYVRRQLSGQVVCERLEEFADIQSKFSVTKISVIHFGGGVNSYFSSINDLYRYGLLLSNLENLTVCCCDENVAQLKNCENVRILNLANSSITDKGLQQLTALTRLEELSLVCCLGITDDGLSLLSHSSLHSLDLTCCHITDMGLAALSTLKLRKLNLSFCHGITDIGLQALRHMPLCSLNLKSLGDHITNDGLQVLRSLKTLQELDMCSSTDGAMRHLNCLDRLQKLTISNISDVGLADIVQCKQLEELFFEANFGRATITDEGLRMLGTCLSLQTLSFRECHLITTEGLVALTTLTKLKKLAFSACEKISNLGMLNALRVLPDLEELSFYGYGSGYDPGETGETGVPRPSSDLIKLKKLSCMATEIRAISRLTNLQVLALWVEDIITPDNVKRLIKLPHLHTIQIMSCDSIKQVLSHLDKLPQLHTLNLKDIRCHEIELEMNQLMALRYVRTLIIKPFFDLPTKKRLRKRFEIVHG